MSLPSHWCGWAQSAGRKSLESRTPTRFPPEEIRRLNYPVILSWGRSNNTSETMMLIELMPLNFLKSQIQLLVAVWSWEGPLRSPLLEQPRVREPRGDGPKHWQVVSRRVSRNPAISPHSSVCLPPRGLHLQLNKYLKSTWLCFSVSASYHWERGV